MRTFQAWNRDLHKYPPVIWDSENDENGPLIDDEFFKMMMFNSYVNSLEGMFFFVGEFPDLFLVNIRIQFLLTQIPTSRWWVSLVGDWKGSAITHRIHGAAIYGNIYHYYTPDVSIYTIHGSYGLWISYKPRPHS